MVAARENPEVHRGTLFFFFLYNYIFSFLLFLFESSHTFYEKSVAKKKNTPNFASNYSKWKNLQIVFISILVAKQFVPWHLQTRLNQATLQADGLLFHA